MKKLKNFIENNYIRKLLAPGAEAIKDMVITKIKLFGSEGKADE